MHSSVVKFFFLCATVSILLSCKKEENNANSLVLKLTPDEVTEKSGRVVEATLSIISPGGPGTVAVYKTVNLQKDDVYGTTTATPVSTQENQYEYHFTYTLEPEEVDKLVGFNFRFEDGAGNAAEKDLTVHTITSGQQTIYSRKWRLVSRMWTSVEPQSDDIKDCERDNVYVWSADSTYNVEFGTSPCDFDGFNVFDKWELSEDERTLTQEYYSLFDPSARTTETYRVVSISSERLVMEQLLDLTIFGLTDKEVFVSTFEPIP